MAKSILIVDDNAYVRQALCELFKREADSQICREAQNGKEAIEKALELHTDLIVLDLSMPVMNGLDAARALKHQMPAVPIIMFTSYVDRFVEEEARSACAAAVVSRFEHLSVLTAKVRHLLYRDAA